VLDPFQRVPLFKVFFPALVLHDLMTEDLITKVYVLDVLRGIAPPISLE
jgi:hypothetical protein